MNERKNVVSTNLKERGITLIALVITVIIIIILATVAINFAFGENGLINQAKRGKESTEIESTREQLGTLLADAFTEKKINNKYNENDFLDDFIYEREPNAEASLDEISLNGYTFELDRSVPQLGKYVGKTGNLPARIRKVEVIEKIDQTLKIQVTTARAEGATYRYSYKKVAESAYSAGVENNQNTYTFENLERRVKYNFRVELIVEGKVVDEKIIEDAVGAEIFSDIYAETKQYTDAEGKTAWIPKGFAVGKSEEINKINKGLVITDQIDANHYSIGNEFVWIPVNDTDLAEMYNTTTPETASDIALSKSTHGEAATTTKLYSKLRVRSGDSFTAGAPGSGNVREPDILTDKYYGDASTIADRGINLLKSELGYTGSNAEVMKKIAQDSVNEYKAVFESIKKYDGFYIGRYELTSTAENPTVQRNQPVLNASKSSANTWYGLKDACSKVVKGDNKYAQSHMIYGNQWDEVMDWLYDTGAKTSDEINVNSSTWGNYSNSSGAAAVEGAGSPQNSGYSDAWSANNIYDLAGNYFDFTQEAYGTDGRVHRGRRLQSFRKLPPSIISLWLQSAI